MSLNYTTLTGTFRDGSGAPLAGNVTFTPNQTVYAAGIPVATPGAPVVAQIEGGQLLNASGGPLTLLATDNAGLSFGSGTGFFYWTVSLQFGQVTDGWSFFLPSSPATVDLYSLKNTMAAGSQFVPLAGGTMTGELAVPDLKVLGLTGATAASRYAGATASGAPVSGTFAAGDVVVDQTGKVWICTAAGTPGTWTAAGAQLDSTASDFQPSPGVASAGTSSLGARADHVHPDQPWQFRPESFGAKGNGVVINDAVMTSGSPNIAAATSAPFTSTVADQNKYILVSGAGGGTYSPKMFQISTVTDSGHAVLSANATSNTAGTPGAIAYFGTDDTAAIQAAINAAVTYAQAHNGYAEVLFSDKIYIIAGAFTVGGVTLGNFQIGLPIISATSGVKVVLALTGVMKTAPLMHWTQPTAQAHGTILASVRTDGTNDATYGPASVIGGPVSTYGGEPGTFSNALIRVDGIGMLLPYNATMCGIDLFGMLEAHVASFSCMAAAVVPTVSAPSPSLATPGNISNQYTYGIRFPCTGNQVVCLGALVAVEGMCYGIGVSEWTHLQDGHAMYCIGAIGLYSGNGVSMSHHAVVDHFQAENCTNAIIQVDNGNKRILATSIGIESISTTNVVFDPSNKIFGTVGILAANSSEAYQTGGWGNGHALNIVFINQMSTGGAIGPPAVPANNTAFFNYYYRDATVYLTAAGGAVTAIAIDGVATGLTLGTSGTVMIRVPSGHSITLTYASTAPTWQWILD